MDIIQAILLGILQGLTEFLPVSSSGHLVLAETFFNINIDPRALQGFDILLHAGTALALLLCYFKTWKKILISPFSGDKSNRKLLNLLIIATIPGALAGFFFNDAIAETFRSVPLVAIALFLTAVALIIANKANGKMGMKAMGIRHALVMGIAQACALVPGISRSGLTISAGQLTGIQRKEALDFSFLMALPIIAGATVMTMMNILSGSVSIPSVSIASIGFFSSFIASMFAIICLRRFVAQHSLAWFALYLIPVSLFLLLTGT